MIKAPFYGKGMAFPFRRDPNTGGVQVTEGRGDDPSVGLEYIGDRYSIRGSLPNTQNHIAEAIAHILSVRPGEHDTLPEFGSRAYSILLDPNTELTQEEFETWLEVATERWEKRAEIPVPDGVEWKTANRNIDENISRVKLMLSFIKTQVAANLVSPFVTPREARAQEYPLGDADSAGHDWASRYHGQAVYSDGEIRYTRLRKSKPISISSDDIFYEVAYGDTWMLISHKIYGDIRFWWVIADMAVQDAAERGESREKMDITGPLETGLLLRVPSRTRLLMELAA